MPGKSRKSLNIKKIICDQCKKEIKEEKDNYIECDKCGKNYHSECTTLNKRQFEYFVNNESEMYICHLCEGGKEEIRNELQEIKTKLNKLDQLAEIQEAIHFMSKQYDEILKGVAENKKRLTAVEKENRSLKDEIKNLKSSVKFLNDTRVQNDCIVSGLKVAEGVNAVDSVIELSKSVGVDMVPQNINEAYFIRNKRKEASSSDKKMVVVKFSSKVSKNKLMSAKPKLKECENTSGIYVKDFLSKETLDLLNHARTLKTVGYAHVYATGGRVFFKRSEISKPQIIRNVEEVDKMLLNATTTTSKPWVRRSMLNDNTAKVGESDDDASYVSP